jgi:sugar transferase (PEP-CTERM system associated)
VFRHFIPLQAVLLASGEGILFFTLIALLLTVTPYTAIGAVPTGSVGPEAVAGCIAAVVLLVMCSLGMYDRDVMCRVDEAMARSVIAFPLAFLAIGASVASGAALAGHDLIPLRATAIGVPLCGLAALAVRSTVGGMLNDRRLKRRVLVLGAAETAEKIARIAKLRSEPFTLVGFLRCGGETGLHGLQPQFSIETISSPADAARFVRTQDVDEIIVATRERRGLPFQALLECRMRGVMVQDYASVCERETGYLDLDELQPSTLIFNDGFRMNRRRLVAKVLADYLLAVLLLVLTLPVTVPTAIAIRLTSPGPIFFYQERVGRNGKVFRVMKFRSMRTDAEKAGPQWAKVNDDRVTAVGRFIRKVRIDEIPQVINVLKGEMSFVGPRPERPVFVASLAEAIPYFDLRHRVNPGITGWAQINYPYGASVEDAKRKLAYDLYYLKNGGFFLDLVIVLQTVRVILFSSGAR